MNSHIKKIATPVFIALIVLFFVLYLKDIDTSVFSQIEVQYPLLIAATLISLLFRYWGVFVWQVVLSSLGEKSLPNYWILASIYSKAWMARYIPGTVAWIGSKIYLASKHGISKSRLAVSSLVEAGSQIVATLSVSLVILGLDPRLDVISSEMKLTMVLLGVAGTLSLYPPFFNFIIRKAYSTIRRKSAYDELSINISSVVRSYLLYVIGAVITGAGNYLLAASLSPDVSSGMFWYIIGATSLAGALGMATPFVPSGLGVRDGIQLVLLSIILPKEIALVITVASRLWSAAVDVLFYAATVAIERLRIASGYSA